MQIDIAQKYCDELLEYDETEVQKAILLLGKLESIYTDTAHEEIAEMIAKSLFNISYYCLYNDEEKSAFDYLDTLDTLAKKHTTNDIVMWNLSYSYANIIRDISEVNMPKALKTFERLKDWYLQYPNNYDIADRLGDACYNLMIDIRESDKEAMTSLLVQLETLQNTYSDNKDLVQHFMYATLNYLHFFGEEDIENALKLFDKMKEISDKHIENDVLVFESVKAASFLVDKLRVTNLPLALEIFEIMDDYAKKHDDDAEIAYYTIINAYNLIVELKNDDKAKCRGLYMRMLRLEPACGSKVKSMLDVVSLLFFSENS